MYLIWLSYNFSFFILTFCIIIQSNIMGIRLTTKMIDKKVPFDIVDVDPKINKRMLADFSGEKKTFVQVGPCKYLMPDRYRHEAGDFYHFAMRQDDIWINTYPRSGTTLTQELMWLVGNNLDFETAAKVPLTERFPFIEANVQASPEFMSDIFENIKGDPKKEAKWLVNMESRVPFLNEMKSPRYIKTHLPFSLLPPKLLDTSKVVYMARNPKDVAVSYYHHNRLFKVIGYENDFPTYYDYFEKDLVQWSPFWDHIREAWELKDHPNMLFIFYEDLIKDMAGTIRQIADFLGKTMTDEQVNKIVQHLQIDNFRKNTSINPDNNLPGMRNNNAQNFIRKGEATGGKKKEEMTPEISARADKWMEENIAKIPGFKFPSYK